MAICVVSGFLEITAAKGESTPFRVVEVLLFAFKFRIDVCARVAEDAAGEVYG